MYWGKIPVAEIKERQGRKLHQFLSRKVYPYSPFYRALFDRLKLNPDRFRTMDDLKRLPFTTKADLAPTPERPDKYRDFVLQPTPEQLRGDLTITDRITLYTRERLFRRPIEDQILDEYLPVMPTFTTGRSSQPVSFVYTKRDLELFRLAGSRIFQVVGLDRRHDRGLDAFPFAPHLAFWQVVYAADAVGLLVLHSGGGRVMGSQAILRIGELTAPTFLIGTPGYIMHLACLALEQGTRITTLRKVILGAERCSPQYKAKLRQQLAAIGSPDVQIHNIYGFTEARRAWVESADAPDSRFLTYPDMEIFEVVDPETGEPVPEGYPGEVVYTNIDGAGSVVLRYRTGDRVAEGVVYDRCPHTGLILPLLGTTLSRVSEIKKLKGTLVDFNELFAFFNGQPEIIDWQIVIYQLDGREHGPDRLKLRVALVAGHDAAAFDQRINIEFKIATEVSLDGIEHLSRGELSAELGMDTLPKEARILDKRPAG